jgi:serine beta-lactamase-like protein LACTB
MRPGERAAAKLLVVAPLVLFGCASSVRGEAPRAAVPETAAGAPAADGRVTRESWDLVDRIAREEVAAQKLVGLAVGVVQGGRTVYVQGYGLADRERQLPVRAKQTLFRWASVSKTLTAVVALQLAKEGVIDLDAPIERYLPGYRVPATYVQPCAGDQMVANGITYACSGGFFELPVPPADRIINARRLGGHLAGAKHYGNGRGDPVPPANRSGDAAVNTGMEWALAYWLETPLVAIPGQRYSYSTFGFNLLGVVLEKASKRSLAQLVDQRIARPLGLTSLQPDYEWRALPDRAVGYGRAGLGPIRREGSTDVSWKLAGGGFVSTVADFADYCAGLASDRLLTRAEKEVAWLGQHTSGGAATHYGIGFGVGLRDGEMVVAHSGAQEKANTLLELFPSRGACFVLMTNSTYSDLGRIARALEGAVH